MWTGRCPHNVGLKCADEKESLSYTSDGVWECQVGNCAYVAELNYMERFCNSVAELRKDIGATEESDVTISGQLEDIRQQLEWIRHNVGAADDDEVTIAADWMTFVRPLRIKEGAAQKMGVLTMET